MGFLRRIGSWPEQIVAGAVILVVTGMFGWLVVSIVVWDSDGERAKRAMAEATRVAAQEQFNTRQREACESVGGAWLWDGKQYICPVACK